MISLITGRKGSGKTKKLIELTNAAVESTKGNVICIEQGTQLRTNINYRARLIDSNEYKIKGYEVFFGFLAGISAGDNDITDIFVDATLRIGGRNYDDLCKFLGDIDELDALKDKNIVFTISADDEELPKEIFDICKKLWFFSFLLLTKYNILYIISFAQ